MLETPHVGLAYYSMPDYQYPLYQSRSGTNALVAKVKNRTERQK